MNLPKAQYDTIINRLDTLSLNNFEYDQKITDLEQQLDYQIKNLMAAYERIEALEEIIEDELG